MAKNEYLVSDTDPYKIPYLRRVVCAANQFEDGTLVIGPRHYDMTMHDQIRARDLVRKPCTQGFIDQHGVFMSRAEAWVVAVAANQLIRPAFQPNTLFSENLY